ncbi:MAG TPA: hypothetical protein VF534_18425 [Paraburkholderia sp.]
MKTVSAAIRIKTIANSHPIIFPIRLPIVLDTAIKRLRYFLCTLCAGQQMSCPVASDESPPSFYHGAQFHNKSSQQLGRPRAA